jgi:hypothetical protein
MLSNAGRSLALLALAALLGCTTLRPIELDEPLELGPGEGILLIDVASNVPLDRVYISGTVYVGGAIYVGDLPAGHNQRLFAAPAGDYRWAKVTLNPKLAFRMFVRDYWKFRIEPGRISYPGMLMVHGSRSSFWTADSYVLSLNRSAASHKLLEACFPKLLERYPIEYTGRDRDDFLSRYQETQRALRAADTPRGPGDAEAPAAEPTPDGQP